MNKPIIALDFPSFREVEAFLNKFEGESLFVKVGIVNGAGGVNVARRVGAMVMTNCAAKVGLIVGVTSGVGVGGSSTTGIWPALTFTR